MPSQSTRNKPPKKQLLNLLHHWRSCQSSIIPGPLVTNVDVKAVEPLVLLNVISCPVTMLIGEHAFVLVIVVIAGSATVTPPITGDAFSLLLVTKAFSPAVIVADVPRPPNTAGNKAVSSAVVMVLLIAKIFLILVCRNGTVQPVSAGNATTGHVLLVGKAIVGIFLI